MPDPVTGVVAATTVGGSIIGSRSSSRAARAQENAAEMGAAEQRAAREEMRRLLNPYVQAGTPALQGMMDLIGLPSGGGGAATMTQYGGYPSSGPIAAALNTGRMPAGYGYGLVEGQPLPFARGYTASTTVPQPQLTQAQRQNQAIEAQAQNPLFLALARQGEEAMLQNASATGGLRGGNIQGALAQFRPALLNQFVNQQYDRMAGLASLGQSSAAGVGNAGIQTGTNIANLLADAGAARAGNAVAQGNIWSRALGSIGGIAAGGGF